MPAAEACEGIDLYDFRINRAVTNFWSKDKLVPFDMSRYSFIGRVLSLLLRVTKAPLPAEMLATYRLVSNCQF